MKKVLVEESIGMVLGHDMTKIVPGEFKGAAFKKGYVIKPEDIDTLKKMGKDHIYIFELDADHIHENEAAVRMAAAASGEGIRNTEPSEGKVSFVATHNGLLKINKGILEQINGIEQVSMATLHNNMPVKEGQIVAGTRIIPLVTERYRITKVEEICSSQGPAIAVKPFNKLCVGAVITGNEVFYGRIQDKFAPVIRQKMLDYGCDLLDIRYAPDDAEIIKQNILELIALGATAIVTAGGMSVDPDDVTPEGIRRTGAKVVSYGAPVLPGAMFMMAYAGAVPIMGIPACGMYHKTTIFDLIFPRVLSGEQIEKQDITALGYGGLCMNCPVCTYPACGYGKA